MVAGLRKDQQNTFPEGEGIIKKCKSESVGDNSSGNWGREGQQEKFSWAQNNRKRGCRATQSLMKLPL